MVVLLPHFLGETLKTCSICPHVGLVSPFLSRSSFAKRTGNGDGFETYCRGCGKQKRDAYRARTLERQRAKDRERKSRYGPEERAKKRAYQREWCRRRQQKDPEYRRRRVENQLRYEQRLKERLGEEAVRELRRMSRKDLLWRNGVPVPPLEKVQKKKGYSGERWPDGPFHAWVRELSRLARLEDGLPDTGLTNVIHARVAFALGVSERRVYAWLHDSSGWIDAMTVDRAASRHGGITPEQIYWYYGGVRLYGGVAVYRWDPEDYEPKVMRALSGGFQVCHWQPVFPGDAEVEVVQETMTQRCRSPHGTARCEGTAVEGSRFCTPCAERLARVKADLEGRSHAFRKTIKKKGARPTCCNPGCQEARLRGNRYCFACQDEGWDEDDIE